MVFEKLIEMIRYITQAKGSKSSTQRSITESYPKPVQLHTLVLQDASWYPLFWVPPLPKQSKVQPQVWTTQSTQPKNIDNWEHFGRCRAIQIVCRNWRYGWF
jgi:hypothetical protein